MHTFGEPCKECLEFTMKDYLKHCWREMIDFIRWRELAILTVMLVVCFLILGWLGIFIGLVLYYLQGTMQGGAVADIFNEYPPEVIEESKCIAGKKDCKICHDTTR